MSGKKMMGRKVLRKKQLVLAIGLVWGITPLGPMAAEVGTQLSNPLVTEAEASPDGQEGAGALHLAVVVKSSLHLEGVQPAMENSLMPVMIAMVDSAREQLKSAPPKPQSVKNT